MLTKESWKCIFVILSIFNINYQPVIRSMLKLSINFLTLICFNLFSRKKIVHNNYRCSTYLRYIYTLRSHLPQMNFFRPNIHVLFSFRNLLTCESPFVVLGPTLAAFEDRVWKTILCLFLSVSTIFNCLFLHNCPIWYTNECRDGATKTRKHAQIQDICTWAGKNGAVVFPLSPSNLFMVVKIVGGLRLIKIIWKVSLDNKAVPRTKMNRKKQKNKRRHPWHFSTQLSFSSTSVVSGLVPNMS